ncbi:MAG: chaperonin GroEL [Candidatus Brocadiae bacterium]|nr:chaperonin GroEL [Candidatus Brocadiia bacterium]
MSKQLKFDADARESLRRGVEKMARALKTTLGPRGNPVILDRGWGAPNVLDDGAAVADEIELSDPYENVGAQMIKQAASKTGDDAGDGTTTAATLAEAIYAEGVKRVTAGADPMALQRGIQEAAEFVAAGLTKLARKVEGRRDWERVAAVASKDPALGKFVAEALEKVGAEKGVITVEEGKSTETEVKVVQGMHFDRGYLSTSFITNEKEGLAELENPLILIHEEKISTLAKLIPLLEKAAAAKRPLLIIAEDIESEVLATLVVNKVRGVLNVCAVKAPGYGDRRKSMLEDIAVLTGARAIMKDLGIDLEQVELESLGGAKKVKITSEDTTILEGRGKPAQIEGRVASINAEIEETDSDYDREKLEERRARLIGGVAEIRVGASTETEMKERKSRAEDALSATKAAIAEGIVAGGGTALLRAAASLGALKLDGEAQEGVDVVRAALDRPFRQICLNAGVDGSGVIRRILAEKSPAMGYDVDRGDVCDLVERGIIDPVRVVRTALQNAASVAGMLLTTVCVIVEDPDVKKEPAGHHGHHH